MGDAAAGNGSVATSEEMLLAVERWSRARKIRIGDYPDPARMWDVTMTEPGLVGIAQRDGAGRLVRESVKANPEVAVAWALTVEAGLDDEARLVLDAAPTWETGRLDLKQADRAEAAGLSARTPWPLDVAYYVVALHRTYAPETDFDRFVDEVMAIAVAGNRGIEAVEAGLASRPRKVRDGDPKAIETLTALADHLQPHAFDRRECNPSREAAGHALARLVALWLDGDLRETRASVKALTTAWERLTVPCERCDGAGRLTRYGGRLSLSTLPPGDSVACESCNGHGRVAVD